MPVDQGEFLKRYRNSFRIDWTIATNSVGDFELRKGDGVVWLIDRMAGEVRIVSSSNTEMPDVVSLFKDADFSRPLSNYESKSVSPDVVAEIKRSSDVIWGSYEGRKK